MFSMFAVKLCPILNVTAFFVIWFLYYKQRESLLRLYCRPMDRLIRKYRKPYQKEGELKHALRWWMPVYTWLLTAVFFFPGVGLNKLVGELFTNGSDNYFGFAYFAPWVFIAVCVLFKTDPLGYLDAMTPGYALSLATFKLGCYCAACCGGIHVPFRVYYPVGFRNAFPVQLVELAEALAIFFILRKYQKKAKPGTMQPVYLMLYSGLRFCSEFLRREDNVFLCFKVYHFLCLAGVLLGAVEYYMVTHHCKKLFALPLRWQQEDEEKFAAKKKK